MYPQINKCPICHQHFLSDESPPCECWEYGIYGTSQGEGHYSKEKYAIGYSGDLVGFLTEETYDSLTDVMKKEPAFLYDMPVYILRIIDIRANKILHKWNNEVLYKWNNGWEKFDESTKTQ